MSVSGYVVAPFDGERESLLDGLVGLVAGIVKARRDPAYGSLPVTDDQAREIANAVVCNLVLEYRVERLP